MATLQQDVAFGARAGALQDARNSLRSTGPRSSSHFVDEDCSDKAVTKQAREEKVGDEEIDAQHMLRDFKEKDDLSNVVLTVEGEELHVHREVLAQWSPVFMAMFTGPFKESESCRVDLPDKTIADVTMLLNCIYPPLIPVSVSNCMTLLPLVEEYGMSELKKQCERVILAQPPNLDIILLAQTYNMPGVLQKATTACSELPMSKIDYIESELGQHIHTDTLLTIYRNKIFKEEEKRKTAEKSLRSKLASLSLLKTWGLDRNTYPCPTHMCFNEECVFCLKNFRRATLSTIS